MRRLLTKRQHADMRRFFASVLVQILTIPTAIVLSLAVLFACLAILFGLPWPSFASDFAREVVAPVAVLQGKMLLVIASIGVLCLVVGWYRIDALANYAADRLNCRAKRLALFWNTMLAGIHTPPCLPPATELRSSRWSRTTRARVGFIYGETPQLE